MIVYVYIYDNLYCFVMLYKILTSAFKILTTLLSFFFPFVSYFPLFPSFLFPFQVHRFAPIAAPFVISALMDALSFTHVACTFAGLYVLAAISTLFLPIETRGRAIVETASNVNGEMNEENIRQSLAKSFAERALISLKLISPIGSQNFWPFLASCSSCFKRSSDEIDTPKILSLKFVILIVFIKG